MVKFITKSVCMALIAALCVGNLNAQVASTAVKRAKFQEIKQVVMQQQSESFVLSPTKNTPHRGAVRGTFFEDVESHTDFTVNSTVNDWSYIDVDGSIVWGMEDDDTGEEIEWPNSGDPQAFIVFNPNNTVPSLSGDTELQPHSGNKFFACLAAINPSYGYGGTGPNNDWIISPELTNPTHLSFWAKSYIADYGLERMKVAYSTTGTAQGDFTFLTGSSYVSVPAVWTKYDYDLPVGTKYIAINCVSDDAFIFMLDDITIEQEDEGDCDPATNLEVAYTEDCTAELTWEAPTAKGAMPFAPVNRPEQNVERAEKTNPVMQRNGAMDQTIAVQTDEFEPTGRGTNSDIYWGYGLSGSPTTYYKGTVSNPNGTQLGSAGTNIQASEYINGTLYAVSYTSSGNNFGIVDQTTGAFSIIKSNFQNDCVSLCYNPTNGLTYAFAWGTQTASSFGTVDLATGDYSPIGNTPGIYYAAIDNDGICYGIPLNPNADAFFGTINLANGSFSQKTTYSFPTNWVQEMSIDRETNELYWMAAEYVSSTSSIKYYYQINKTTGALTTVATVPSFVTSYAVSAYSIATDAPVNCDPVTNLYISSTDNTVNLSWTAAPGSPTGYRIDYDGNELTTVTTTSYTHNSVPDGLHTYTVTALFSGSCIPLGVTKTIIVGDMCMFRIEMHDSNMDGWEDSYILVTSGGTTYGTFSCPNDAATSIAYVVLPSGIIQFTWVNSGGYYDSDASFEIYNSADELIYQCNNASTLSGVFFTYENECTNEPDPIVYNIYRDGELLTTVIEETNYTDTGFDDAVEHTWSIKVACISGDESSSVSKTLEACNPPPPCNPVTDLNVDIAADACIAVLTWTAAADMPDATYNVYRDGTQIASDVTETEYEDYAEDGFHTWTVKTICENGEATGVDVTGICGTGINELTNNVTIYPNPAANTVTIELKDFAKVEIYNTVGHLIETKTVNVVDLSSYNTGIYFFKVYDVYNNSVTKRVMVAR